MTDTNDFRALREKIEREEIVPPVTNAARTHICVERIDLPTIKAALRVAECVGEVEDALLDAAKVRNLGDIKWLATEDGSAGKGTGRHIAAFILLPLPERPE